MPKSLMHAVLLMAAFAQAACSADRVTIYEGLPHQLFERELLESERRSKPVRELDGYPFYQAPLAPSAEDAKRLTLLLSDPATFSKLGPDSPVPACGGFHPDYAVEWQQGSSVYRALLCFGCREAKLFGPGIAERYDLRHSVELEALLTKYRKNRPLPSQLCKLLLHQGWASADYFFEKQGAHGPWDRFRFAVECAQRGYSR